MIQESSLNERTPRTSNLQVYSFNEQRWEYINRVLNIQKKINQKNTLKGNLKSLQFYISNNLR